MQRLTAKALLCFALTLLLAASADAFLPDEASAQANAQQLAEANRVAMDAYNNLDIESAKKTLEDAAKGAEKHGVKGPALARTYANLGVVQVGGLSDNAAGLDAFVKALQQDPSVEPDPLVSTPEIQQVYLLAKRKVGAAGSTAPQPSTVTPPVRTPGPVEGNLQHVPAAEQLSQTGVPVYVELPPDLEVESVEIFYRSLGMSRPKSAPMKRMGEGYGFLIPCTDVFEPNVEYFIVAKDADGNRVGNAGTPQAPVSVPVVTQRSQPAAALPGQAPPAQCTGGEECPPGMPGCSGKKGLGDTCQTDSDCGEGLACADDFCAMGEREESGRAGDSKAPRFFLDLGGSYGAAYVGNNAQADSSVPKRLVTGVEDPTPANLKATARRAGWDCEARTVTNAMGEPVTQLRDCTVAVDQPGFVPNGALQFAAGYYVTPKLSIGVMGRVQLKAGQGTLAGMLFGGRLGYLLTKPVQKGFVASLFAGAGFGQIQVQPPAQAGGKKGPWVVSGLGDAQLGASLGYRFMRNIAINVQPQTHFLLPTFLFDLDVVGAIEVSF